MDYLNRIKSFFIKKPEEILEVIEEIIPDPDTIEDLNNKTLQELIDIIEEKNFEIDIPILNIDDQIWSLRSNYGEVNVRNNFNRKTLGLKRLYEFIRQTPELEYYLKLHLEEAILVQI
jgi:hypothetical protein